VTDDEIQSIKRRHEAALDGFASSHADRGVLLEEVLRLRAQRALENEDLTRAFDMGRDKAQHAIAAWLRYEPETLRECDGHRHADGKTCSVLVPMTAEEIAAAIERGDYTSKREKP